ncbi:hypothetical protein KGF54_002505 [Candida jiufengensis]|uniref:uncharacterized protein n=1 Tax=Candida jiufengensis TaxID=497108 RepID=UPI0022249859|nr:uncharacterized protein KGF54_002505 [Candida jiufengensis]KAI5953134.1 hypothetical protein KGF54_002505 [Candida jiufengensis]
MRANSTQISNRIFKSQRFVILIIISCFTILLIITGISGHHQKIVDSVSNYTTKASQHLQQYYDTNNKISTDDIQMEKAAEEQEEEDRLKEVEEAKIQKGKGKLNEIDPKIKLKEAS